MDYFRRVTDPALFHDFMHTHSSIKFVRHIWLDYSGIQRQRIVTKSHCEKIYGGGKWYGLGPALMINNIASHHVETTAPKQQLFHLVPDWESVKVCHFSPGHAWVMCFAHCAEDEEGPLRMCPRFLLAKVLERAARDLAVKFLMGCEIEFTVLGTDMQPLTVVDTVAGWASAAGLRDGKLAMMEDVVEILQSSDVGVLHIHSEGLHQLEISTDPFEPMQAADNLIYTYEVIRVVGLRHGYLATMAVNPLGGFPTATNGLHFSIYDADGMEPHFLAGILRNLPLIVPFSMPTHDSYNREQIDRNGTWISWGTENRDVAIRAISSNHWEFRLLDHHANIHLMIAIMLHMGLNGIRDKEPLVWHDVRYFTTDMSDAELAAKGVTERLPSNFRDSFAILCKSDGLKEFLGLEMKHYYERVKRGDEEALCQMTSEQRRKLYITWF